jgi:hypothetical protein
MPAEPVAFADQRVGEGVQHLAQDVVGGRNFLVPGGADGAADALHHHKDGLVVGEHRDVAANHGRGGWQGVAPRAAHQAAKSRQSEA